MGNAKKTVIHIPELTVGQYLFVFFWYQLLFKNFIDLQSILEIKKDLALAKKTEMLKN